MYISYALLFGQTQDFSPRFLAIIIVVKFFETKFLPDTSNENICSQIRDHTDEKEVDSKTISGNRGVVK